jgi:uncharacterized protein (UPF0264 family)
MLSVVAGGLSRQLVQSVAALGPDYVAVRGAACFGSREGTISRPHVEELVQLVQRQPAFAAAVGTEARQTV